MPPPLTSRDCPSFLLVRRYHDEVVEDCKQFFDALREMLVAGVRGTAVSPATLKLADHGPPEPGKPVVTVWLAWGTAGMVRAERLQLGGDRDAVRHASVSAALQRLTAAARA